MPRTYVTGKSVSGGGNAKCQLEGSLPGRPVGGGMLPRGGTLLRGGVLPGGGGGFDAEGGFESNADSS